MKKRLKAKEEFYYGGATRKVGDEFEATDPDANILVCIGKASAVEAAAPKLQTTAIRAEQPKVPQEETQNEPAPRRRREYRRRDMVPEE